MDIFGYNMAMMNAFRKIDTIQQKINQLRPLKPELLQTLQEKLRIEWTYNSNAIEGNTLTYGETAFFLREGLTSEGKPLKDYLEAKNHAEAIDGLHEIISLKRPLTESLIKELHGVLMKDIEFTYAKGADGNLIKKPFHPGAYKTRPNHVLTISGKIHYYTDPLHVKDEMEELMRWFHKAMEDRHIVETASVFHYRFVAIHPFEDGNGRMARLLMNLILMQAGFPPCIIKTAHRKKYLKSLEETDVKKDFAPFIEFIEQEFLETLESIEKILEEKETVQIIPSKSRLNKNQRETLILEKLKNEPQSIGQILEHLPNVKRPTLKNDLKNLARSKRIKKKGVGKGTVYFL